MLPVEAQTTMAVSVAATFDMAMVMQEINRYADSEFRYADKSDEAAIEAMVRDLRRSEEARRRYLGQGGAA